MKLGLFEIEVGLKIKANEETCKELMNDKELNEKFKLNIKRLNRWWYSIYFDNR